MAYKNGNRDEVMLFPPTIEEYVGKDDPVRAYDAVIDAMDMKELGFNINGNKVGNSEYNPISMLKLLVFGYSYGWRSSRKLERTLYHNFAFIWLLGGLKPDHKTISNFRKKNIKAIKNVMKQCAIICTKLNLIEGNCLFVDGTKLRGSASLNKTLSKEKLEEKLASLDDRIDQLLKECDEVDSREDGSYVKMDKELQDSKKLKAKIDSLLKKMEEENLKKVNTTDPEAVIMHGRQGIHPGYNGQLVTDEKHGLIVNADVVTKTNDRNQFSKQIKQANENLGKDCKTAVADAGYSNIEDIEKTAEKGIDVIVPSQKQAAHNPKDNPFDKDKFIYNEEKNQYICPEGKILRYAQFDKTRDVHVFIIKKVSDCLKCPHYGLCTKGKNGRRVVRLINEELKIKLEERYSCDEGQVIYSKRREKAELQFGHIKRNLNAGYFLLRGLEAVQAEFSILASCFNITRMINLLGGTSSMVNLLKTLRI
jgi:transposase